MHLVNEKQGIEPPRKSAVLASEASLNTLQIEVRAMIVRGRQMTLATFRQIPPDEATVWETGELRPYVFWGHVRYPMKLNSRETEKHDLWAVAENAGRLYRCAIWPEEEYPHRLWHGHKERAPHSHAFLDDHRQGFFAGQLTKEQLDGLHKALDRDSKKWEGNSAPYWDSVRETITEHTKRLFKPIRDARAVSFGRLMQLPQLFIAT